MSTIEKLLATIALLLILSASLITVHKGSQLECVRTGIQAGWATEAIKELCK